MHAPPVPGMPGQTPACAPVPHAMPPGHDGQSSTPPQPFPIRPQYWPPPIGLQVIAVQLVGAHTPGTPPAPHDDPAAQSPHASVPPQPSPMVPQYCVVADLHVSGTHPAFTQTPAVQTSPVPHAPQSSFVPQPSPTVPQYLAPPPDAQVIRWQLAPPTQMSDMQTLSPEQVPHSSAPPLQPLPILPQYWPPAACRSPTVCRPRRCRRRCRLRSSRPCPSSGPSPPRRSCRPDRRRRPCLPSHRRFPASTAASPSRRSRATRRARRPARSARGRC